MPPKSARNRQKEVSKRKALRTPLPSAPAPKITLKINTSQAPNDSSSNIAAGTSLPVPNLGAESVVPAAPATIAAQALLLSHPVLLPPALPALPSIAQPLPPSEPIIIRSPSPSQIEIWVVELEIRCYLDGERISSTLGKVTNKPEAVQSTYISIKASAEDLADRTINSRGISSPRRDHTVWYGTYGAQNNPTEVDVGDSTQFDHLISRVRNWGVKGKEKLLKLQICFGINLTPQSMVRPPWKEPVAPKAPVIAIPKRVFQEDDHSTAKKPRTATNRLLEDAENAHEAEKGSFKSIMTAIQVRWACMVDSCTSSTRFCFVNDGKHYHLSREDIRRWGHDIVEEITTVDEPELLHRYQLSQEFAKRMKHHMRKTRDKGKKKSSQAYQDESSSPERQQAAQNAPQTPFWPPNSFPFQYPSMPPPPMWSPYAYSPYSHPAHPQLNVAPPSQEYTAPEPQLPPVRSKERVESEFLSMADLRESSPLRSGDKQADEVLFALKSFLRQLHPPLSNSIAIHIDFTVKTFVEQEYDIDMVKDITVKEAIELGIKVGVLKTIQKQLKPFKKWYNIQDVIQEGSEDEENESFTGNLEE